MHFNCEYSWGSPYIIDNLEDIEKRLRAYTNIDHQQFAQTMQNIWKEEETKETDRVYPNPHGFRSLI
jgi:hypothetical protein